MIYLDKLVIYLICVLGIFYHFYGFFFSFMCIILFLTTQPKYEWWRW